jgi:RHS repeat-associated protein
VHRSFVRSLVAFTLLLLPLSLTAQTTPAGGTQTQAQQGPCLPEDEPCGGGGTNSVTVLPDDGVMTVASSSSGNVAEFTVLNNYGSSYTYALTCSAIGVGTCTAIKNVAGATITSINLPGGGQAEVMVHFSAGVGPASGTVRLTANNGLWSDQGAYGVTVSAPLTPAAPTAQLINHNRSGIDRGLCFTTGAGAAAGNSCGDLFIIHGMPAYRTMGRDRSLSVLYNSATARGQVLEAIAVTQPAGSATPTKMTAVLRVGGLKDSAEFSGVVGGQTVQVVMGDRLANTLATGVYVDTLVLRNTYSGSVFETILVDTVVVVNQRTSEYGRGWGLLGVERLVLSQPTGSMDLLWVAGDGSALRYRKVADSIWLAPAAAYRDSIIKSGSTYTRRLQHKVRVVYDLSGRHLQTVNRYGHVTQFTYDTVSGVIRLKGIRVPGNDVAVREYRLFYSAAPARLLDSIADPGGRKLKLTRSGTAITAITDPDGQQTQFVYGGPDSLLSARRVPNPVVAGGWAQTSYSYAGRSKLVRTRVQAGPTGLDSTVVKYAPWQVNGLDTLVTGLTAPGFPTWPVAGFASTLDGPIAGIGDRYSAWLDRFGAPTRTLLEWTGAVTELYRDSTSMPALVTGVRMSNGRFVSLRYNTRGNLVMQRDSTWHIDSMSTAVSQWAYGNAVFPDMPTSVTDPMGRVGTMELDPILGVPVRMVDPTGQVGRLAFLSNGLLQSATDSGVQTWRQSTGTEFSADLTTSFEYDTIGQVRKTTSPSGAVNAWQSDAFGRVIASWDAFNARTRYNYDLLGRDTSVVVDADTSSNPLGVSSTCRSAEFTCGVAFTAWPLGFPTTLVTRSYFGTVGLDSVVAPRGVPRTYGYDASGQPIRELDEIPSQQSTRYVGGSGLVDSIESRSGNRTIFQYDGVGRLIRMTYPRIITDASPYTRLAGTFDTIPGDTVTYLYDAEGRVLETRSLNVGGGVVTRTYWANGLLRSRVTSKPFLDSLKYWYDASGAVTRKWHVSFTSGVAANAMRDTTDYQYHGTTGRLQSIAVRMTNPTGVPTQTLAFEWDALGRRRRVTYPTGWAVNYRYDAAGTLRRLWTDGTACDVADQFCVSVSRDSVDLTGRVLSQRIDCHGTAHDGRACGAAASRTQSNRYYRTGWLASQVDGQTRDSLVYDATGNIVRRWRHDDQRWHGLSYVARTNRLFRDTLEHTGGQAPGVMAFHYTADGSRRSEAVVSAETWQQQLQRDYRYDALGRLRGLATRRFVGMQDFESYFEANACQYDPEGRMVRACGAPAKVVYDGDNVIAASESQWHFVHGPAIDDPLIGFGQKQEGDPVIIVYWITDGGGSEYGASLSNGSWDASLNSAGAVGGQGWQQAGGVRNSGTLGEQRQGNSNAPQLAFFRNRVYDMRTGQWTQEDPIGLAGGLNLYQYSGNNPVSFSDPWGLCPLWYDGIPCEQMVDGGMVPANTNMASGVGGAEWGWTRSNGSQFHSGFDNKGDYGAPVYAPADGTLSVNHSPKGGLGVTLDLGHGNSVQALHLSRVPRELMGQTVEVKAGDIIGYIGRSGNLKDAPGETHTHIKTYSNGSQCDPRDFFGMDPGSCSQ